MFKKTLLLLMVALTVISCQKNVDETVTLQEVSFSASELTPDVGLKSGNDVIDCKTDVPTNAWVKIEGVDYYPALFTLDGKLYTQAIKLPVGTTYTVEEFVLYKESGTTLNYQAGEDVTVYATPLTGATYAQYVTTPLSFDFSVTAFAKAQVDIQVLCFQDHQYADFGFNWFAITEIVVRQFCFFGDICITDANAAAFAGSIYAQGGLDPDEEAAFRVIVKDGANETPYSPFDNMLIYGTGKALCVDYPDNLSQVNNFTFELQIWVPSTVAGTFVWQTYASFTSTDAGNLFYGTENLGDNSTVKSFALGTCSPMSNPIFTWLAPIDPPVAACDPFQGFEVDTKGWDLGYGVATRVPSGTDGITAAAGNYFAYFSDDATNETGPFTRYCGYTCEWTGTWTTEIYVYLDTQWALSSGFQYTVAANGSDCEHQRDFVFHVTKDASTGQLLVAGSNNAATTPDGNTFIIREDLETINHFAVSSSGWYILQHVFNDVGGYLSVDLNLRDSGGSLLWTETRTSTQDAIPADVSGHRYGWFTNIVVPGGLAVDNSDLTE